TFMLKSLLTCLFTMFMATPLIAHEGHDHGPSQVQAPKGGIIRSLEAVHLELLTKGKTLSLYVYDTDLKPEDAKKFPVSASVTLPKKKAQALPLIAKGDHWEAE